MRKLAVVLSLVLGIGFADGATPEQISGLINRLGSADYRERQAAYRELDAAGEAALALLKSAATSAESEVRHRALELVRRIEQRLAAARILAPTMVELDFDNTPLGDALRQASTRTGLSLSLPSNDTRLSQRKITYHSGKVGAWEAVAGLARAADLNEWDGLTSVPGLPSSQANQANMQSEIMMAQGVVRGRIVGSGRGNNPQQASKVFLYEGFLPAWPMHHAGAVRVRVLPFNVPLPASASGGNDIIVPLQVSAESKIEWQKPPAVKLAEAIDDNGQKLTASVIGAMGPAIDDDEMFFFNNFMMGNAYGTNTMPQRSQYVVLRFRRGELPSKSFRELTGTLTLPVRVAGEIMALERPLAAAGTSSRTDYGELTVHSLERAESGDVKMDIAMEFAAQTHPQMMPLAGPQVAMKPNIQVQGGMIVQQMNGAGYTPPKGLTDYMGLSLVDAKGAKCQIGHVAQSTMNMGMDGSRSLRVTLTFKANGTDPSRLVVHGQHPAALELSFSFKDLPLQ